MKIYLAGPMTGIPQFNFPAFYAAAARLRELGHTVINPAEEDPPEVQAAAMASPDGRLHDGKIAGKTWGDILAEDVKTIADDGIEAIALLHGWWNSRGAKLEAFTGLLCGIEHYQYRARALWPIDPADVMDSIARSTKL